MIDSFVADLAEFQARFRAAPRRPITVGTRVITSLRDIGTVEKIDADAVQVRVESPWGFPFPFAEWFDRDNVLAVNAGLAA